MELWAISKLVIMIICSKYKQEKFLIIRLVIKKKPRMPMKPLLMLPT